MEHLNQYLAAYLPFMVQTVAGVAFVAGVFFYIGTLCVGFVVGCGRLLADALTARLPRRRSACPAGRREFFSGDWVLDDETRGLK